MNTYRLGDVCSRLSSGRGISASEVSEKGQYPVVGGNGVRGYADTFNFAGDCAVIGRQGAACGNVRFYSGKAYMTEHAVVACTTTDHNTRYLAYLLSTMGLGRLSAQSAQPGLSVKTLAKQLVSMPDLETQNRTVELLGRLDDKIALNRHINDYLTSMLIALQKRVSETGETKEFRADELFSIHIGKTPPRKQHEWFSFKRADNVVWMSIKDMGGSDAYLIDSSEYLTKKAIERFHIKVCEPGSILLSFKLTVGRVGIVANEMATNEAIACFSSDDRRRLSYLYPLLLEYDYSTLGNTSSIATAVNSKTIKAMPLQMPNVRAQERYYRLTLPIYQLLLGNIIETANLESIRDSLLPKLMSGEIDVSKIELPTPPNNHLCAY